MTEPADNDSLSQISDETPLYNSRIIKTHIECLATHFPGVDIDALLKAVDIRRQDVEEPARWFNQRQVDAFHDEVVRRTGNKEFSQLSGRYYSEAVSLGPLRQFTIGLINLGNVFAAMSRLYPFVSKGARLSSRRLAVNRVEIIAEPYPGVNEKRYQCDNRVGVFESIGKFLGHDYNRVEHPECRYRGGERCRYIVSWKISPNQRWVRLRNLSLPLGLIVSIACFASLPLQQAFSASLATALIVGALFYRVTWMNGRDLLEIVARQTLAAEVNLERDKQRYGYAQLFKELGQVISEARDTDGIIRDFSLIMAQRLPFDRGAFLLENHDGNLLEYCGGYGFTATQQEMMASKAVSLAAPHDQDLITRVFSRQEPEMVENPEHFQEVFSGVNAEIAVRLGGTSMVAAPIVHQNRSLGVLLVDNTRNSQPPGQSDVAFLTAIASQAAVAIVNARAFEQVRESEARYRLLADNVSDTIWVLELEDLRFSYVSPSVTAMRGYTPEEAMALSLEETLTPEAVATASEMIMTELERDGQEGVDPDRTQIIEVENIHKDGSTLWTEITARFLRNDAGQPVAILGLTRDIRERRKADRERRQLQERLQRAEKMEALGTLAGGVAHDLNNILSGIVSYPDLLLMDLPEDSPMRNSILTIRKSGQKAAAIVQDLLTLARRGASRKDVLNLNDIIREHLTSPEYRELMELHPTIEVETRLQQELPNVTGAAVHLSKVLMNLISNAAEAMPAGGCITITTESVYQDIPASRYEEIPEGEFVRLRIADEGVGISSEDLQRLFDPFYTRKRMKRSGSGLGTTIIWSTVKDHGGFVDVVTEEGAGTRFDIYLPSTREETPAVKNPAMLEDYVGSERILIIDDVVEQREVASRMLTKLGYQVASVASGEEAQDYLAENRADLLVLDMIMPPGMDGLETYQKIIAAHPGQKAIINSGFAETDRVRQLQRLGAGNYIRKPFTLEQIGSAVRSELDAERAPAGPAKAGTSRSAGRE
jgi:PAS domain S-box-containing protein